MSRNFESSSDIWSELNEQQAAAATFEGRNLLVLAGAGTGKTRTIIARAKYLLDKGVPASRILILSFTRKSAKEIVTRLQASTQRDARALRGQTFHSWCMEMIEQNPSVFNFGKFTVIDEEDRESAFKLVCGRHFKKSNFINPSELAEVYSYAINARCNLSTAIGCRIFNGKLDERTRERILTKLPVYQEAIKRYMAYKSERHYLDYDDILQKVAVGLKKNPEAARFMAESYDHILIDEMQDTNPLQYLLLESFWQRCNLFCVGDDAQSIYSFRGAKIENILSFQKDFPAARVFKLEQNYRSTRTIVDAANSVIVRNSKRMEKHCFSAGDVGEPIRILKAYTDREEAEMVVSDLRDKVRSAGDDWSEAVILYRTNNQSAVLEDNLRRRGIPYRIYKGSSFYDHKEVKDMLAYIRLVINPRDDEAFKRIVNYPTRGIGDTTVQRIAQLAAERGVSMWEAVDALVAEPAADPVQKTIARKVADFVAMIRSLSLARNEKGLYDFGLEIATRSGILAAYRAENTPEATSALDNIEELLNSMQEFKERCDAEIRNGERPQDEEATIEEWLQNVMLVTDMDKDDPEDRNKVTLMTVHSAKGLEYKYVYIVGLEENLFPSQRAAESPDGMEEERRLFYVALTRAKVEATISYAEMRFKWGNMEFSRPSCFLREIDPKYVRADFGTGTDDDRPHRSPDGSAPSAIDELRRRFDYRFQQKQQGGGRFGGGGNGGSGGYGSRSGSGGGFGRAADGESGPARRFARAAESRRPAAAPDPALVQTPRPSTDGMRRVGVRQATDGGLSSGSAAAVSGEYVVGQRVEHPKFGVGIVQRIETLATDHKLVVAFDGAGEKTLLAKFAKLTKL